MQIVLGSIVRDFIKNHDALLEQLFASYQDGSLEDPAPEVFETFDQAVAETIMACDALGLAEIILQAPARVRASDGTFWADPRWQTDSPGLSFLRSAASDALIGFLYVEFTGSP